MDYKSPFQSSIDQCLFRNVLIHMAGYNKSLRHDLEGNFEASGGSVHTLSQSHRGGRPTFTFFPLSSCHFFSCCHSYFTGAQLSRFYSKHHKFASACSLQTPVVAIVSFYKVNNRSTGRVPGTAGIVDQL